MAAELDRILTIHRVVPNSKRIQLHTGYAYGVKYKASGVLSRPGYRPGRVLTVWIVEDDSPPRLLTAYPDDLQ